MNLKAAKSILREEESCATACMYSMDKLLGSTWMPWEPETLWLTLDRMRVTVPVGNREQILAARSLITTGRFYYDMHAFEKTGMAFNNEEGNYDSLDAPPVMYLAWAVTEADMIHKKYEGDSLVLDREPREYTAIQLHREGFIVPPSQLDWAQSLLTGHNANDAQAKKLQQEITTGWAAAPRGKTLLDAAYPETPAGVQLARLAVVQIYCDRRRAEREKQLASLL